MDKFERWFKTGYWYWLVFVIAALVFYGLIGMSQAYTEIGKKEVLDFMWQIIILDFVLATLTLSINPAVLSPDQRNHLPLMGFCFALAGIAALVAIGLITMGVMGTSSMLKMLGGWLSAGSLITSSFSMGMMALTLLERPFLTRT